MLFRLTMIHMYLNILRFITIVRIFLFTEGRNRNIRYEIKKRKFDTLSPPLSIDAVTGEIRTLRALDFETTKEYSVLGYAKIEGNKNIKATTRITLRVLNVDDVPLRFTHDVYEAYIDENTPGQVNNLVELEQGDSDLTFSLKSSTL